MDLRRDRFNSTAIFTVVLVAVLAVTLNYPYQYLPTETRSWQSNFALSRLYGSVEASYIHYAEGGFPWTWASNKPDFPGDRFQYSWTRLTLNIGFWTIVASLLTFMVSRFRKHSYRPWSWSIPRRLALTSEGLVAITGCLLILAFGATGYLGFLRELRASRQLQQHGMVITYAMLPQPLAKVLPSWTANLFSRIREVALWKPTPQTVERAIQTESLTALVLIESSLTPETYDALGALPNLHALSLRYQTLTPGDLEGIGKIKSLQSLDLRSCKGLENWDCDIPLDRLTNLRVTHCDLKLSNLRLDRFKQTLQSAYLSRPRSDTDRLSLNGFSALNRLSLSRMNGSINDNVLDIRLCDLPELSSLSIDLGQVFDLDVLNAPRLATITYVEDLSGSGMRARSSISSTPMMRKVHLQNVPLLRELEIDGMHLEKISIDGADSLMRITIGQEGQRPSQSTPNRNPAIATRLQQVIHDIGNLRGPQTVEFLSMPMGGIDLKPLQKNDRLRSLCMIGCGLTDDQANQISGIENLHSIDLRGCPVSDQQAMKLLKGNSELQSLLVSTHNFETIEIVDQDRLKSFFATEALNAVSVLIKDAPQLSAELLLGAKLATLRIENARSLLGLSVDGRLPPQSALEGLRALRFFAIGGPEATDELCRTVWECNDLDHLTIAYGSLGRRSLEKVGLLENLTVLSMPGSVVDDDIVLQNWKNLRFLSHVNLNDTKITGAAAQWLCRQKNLQRLAVNHCPIHRSSLASLADVAQLIELEVAGIGLEVTVLKQCLSKSLIDRLNLSDFPLSPEHVEVLASSAAKNIRFLGIANCGLSDEQVRAITEENPYLAVDVDGNTVSEATRKSLEKEGRLVNRHDRRAFLKYLSLDKNGHGTAPLETIELMRGRINDYQFASTSEVKP